MMITKDLPIYNEGGITIGSKNIRQLTPIYSFVNNIVEELCISLFYFFLSAYSKRKS